MTLIKGRDLKDQELWKSLNPNLNHYNYVWHEGVNIDPLPWNPSGDCEAGGLYFTTWEHLHHFISICEFSDDLVARVYLDDDEDVWQTHRKYKAHKVTLGKITKIKDLPDKHYYELIGWQFVGYGLEEYDESRQHEQWLKMVAKDGWVLEYVRHQDRDTCLVAVEQNGLTLRCVKNQDKEICLAAVKEDGDALRYVTDQDEDICLAAVKQTGCALAFVEKQNKQLCMTAVKQNGWALRHVQEQDQEICLAAVKEDGFALRFVEPQFRQSCLDYFNSFRNSEPNKP